MNKKLNINQFPSTLEYNTCLYNYTINDIKLINTLPSKDILENQWQNYIFYSINYKFGICSLLLENNNGEYYNQNRTITIPIDTVKKDISFLFDLEPWQFTIENRANDIKCALVIPDIDDNWKLIIKSMKQLGWYCATKVRFNKYNNDWLILRFEPMYDLDVTDDIHKLSIIYHISPYNNYKSIKKNGFMPYSKNNLFDYPDRVHFIKGVNNINKNNLLNLIQELYNINMNKDITKYNIYTLDVNKIPKYIKFQNDPNMDNGIFTYNKVPYSAVSNTELIDLSKEFII